MLIIVGVIISLLEIRDLKNNQTKIFYLYTSIILISILIYIFKEDINNIYDLIGRFSNGRN